MFASVVAAQGHVALSAAPASAPWPWPYDWSRFPAAWFGANATHWESPEQIDAIGKYAMAILGWQHLGLSDNMTAVVYPQLAQMAIIKGAHPSLPVFVYCSFGWAFGMNAAVWPLMSDPGRYKDFFLQSTGGSFEFSRTNCYQEHTNDKHCIGWFWNFANASARDYFVEKLVTPLAYAPIDGVFFDAVNYGYDIPEVRPWGKPVVNVPNCSSTPPGGGAPGWGGCEALLNGTLDVARRTTQLLNAHGKVPLFANPAYFARPPDRRIWLDEARLVAHLQGLQWATYYESFRGDTALGPQAYLQNMREEAARGVPAVVHTYYKQPDEDPTPHVAGFLLARSEQWYYLGSNGWWDDSYHWAAAYDACAKCGKPLGSAAGDAVMTRAFEGCNVTLDCTNSSACVGRIEFPPA